MIKFDRVSQEERPLEGLKWARLKSGSISIGEVTSGRGRVAAKCHETEYSVGCKTIFEIFLAQNRRGGKSERVCVCERERERERKRERGQRDREMGLMGSS